MKKNKQRAALVWLISAATLFTYASFGLLDVAVPGVEELVAWLGKASGWEFYVAGFVAILIEGLYVIGNFFPGTTIVLLLAVLSGVGGWSQFALTILAIFLGWCLAGCINILVAKKSLGDATNIEPVQVHDSLLLTWFPAFRANYEVAQIAAGSPARDVLFSAVRVRFFASLFAATFAALLSVLIDIQEIDNEEGFLSVLTVATIMAIVGIYQFKKASRDIVWE